ncbi:patatin-like phospholipase [Legionella geestiana]|uniref:Patatin-like phospholipase n=1 Tax=Legionella geestiana TaxID=45065 RepID=A0A0W0TYI1_9GAMM|nr:patatin-like phospholipase family protein [Legionella geestiana]KTD00682.1 patatin-like phospholipase [Legionella geestiana]QBS11705.1 cyclic nucleotide-binding domain-containing protein [Legionella geestiana]QDQ40683.1 cyclic nucleotide-binding domain-containing protein [Legionella geestiana]STX53607.1 patatin-like phospholipase [Legionella geestiana]
MDKYAIHSFLQRFPPFDNLPSGCLKKLSGLVQPKLINGGEFVMRQGELGEAMFIVVRGRLCYEMKDALGQCKVWGDLSEGAVVGEMALISGYPRSADVFALRDSLLLELSRADFMALGGRWPELVNALTAFVTRRLTDSLHGIPIAPGKSSLVILIPVKPIAGWQVFLQSLDAAFTRRGKIRLLTSGSLLQLGIDTTREDIDVQANALVNARANDGERWVFVADEALTPWTKWCIRQGDLLAFFAPAATKHVELSESEQYFKSFPNAHRKRSLLVMLHEGQSPPSPQGTMRWLQPREVNTHYHIRWQESAGIARLLRILTDSTIAVVLSGGGARGMAHLGMLRMLDELKIPVDYIGGTSMGAIIAGIYVTRPFEEWMSALNFIYYGSKIFLTYPWLSISSGRRISDSLSEGFSKETRIEDLWTNYFCVSTDLTENALFVHERGSLWKAIRASSSMPLVYPPVAEGGKLLVDGGVLNNLPVDIMMKFSHGSRVIASCIREENLMQCDDFPAAISGWSLLFSSMLEKDHMVYPVNFMDTINRVMGISSSQTTQRMLAMADFVFSLDMGAFSFLEFKRYEKIFNEGHRQALMAKGDLLKWISGDTNG